MIQYFCKQAMLYFTLLRIYTDEFILVFVAVHNKIIHYTLYVIREIEIEFDYMIIFYFGNCVSKRQIL